MMWNFASNTIAKSVRLKNGSLDLIETGSESSDDDTSSNPSKEEGLECQICCESFNIVENVPYVLWCGHTLCKNCILGLQWAVVKFPTLPIQLPLFISCPWCNLLSFRLVYRGDLKFPRKNYFLLWMVESMNGDRIKSHSTPCEDHQSDWRSSSSLVLGSHVARPNISRQISPQGQSSPNLDNSHINSYLSMERVQSSLQKSVVFFVHLTAKFPLVLLFLVIILNVIPASAVILAMYVLITVILALPSFLILYFAYPTLDWLVREIVN